MADTRSTGHFDLEQSYFSFGDEPCYILDLPRAPSSQADTFMIKNGRPRQWRLAALHSCFPTVIGMSGSHDSALAASNAMHDSGIIKDAINLEYDCHAYERADLGANVGGRRRARRCLARLSVRGPPSGGGTQNGGRIEVIANKLFSCRPQLTAAETGRATIWISHGRHPTGHGRQVLRDALGYICDLPRSSA